MEAKYVIRIIGIVLLSAALVQAMPAEKETEATKEAKIPRTDSPDCPEDDDDCPNQCKKSAEKVGLDPEGLGGKCAGDGKRCLCGYISGSGRFAGPCQDPTKCHYGNKGWH